MGSNDREPTGSQGGERILRSPPFAVAPQPCTMRGDLVLKYYCWRLLTMLG